MDFSVMIKACHDAEQARQLVEETMPRAGLDPGPEVLGPLLGAMMIEGDKIGARKFADRNAYRGSHGWSRATGILEAAEEKLSRMRTARLSSLLEPRRGAAAFAAALGES